MRLLRCRFLPFLTVAAIVITLLSPFTGASTINVSAAAAQNTATQPPSDLAWKEVEALAFSLHKLLRPSGPLSRLQPAASRDQRALISHGHDVLRRVLEVDQMATEALNRLKRGLLEGAAASLLPSESLWLREQVPFGPTPPPPPPDHANASSRARELEVVDAIRRAWRLYASFGHGHDEVTPLTLRAVNYAHLGLTALSALDTFLLLELGGHAVAQEIEEAKLWASHALRTDHDVSIHTRVVAGKALPSLLSSFALSGDVALLQKAADLWRRTLPAYQTESGLAVSHVNLWGGELGAPLDHLDTQHRGRETRNHSDLATASAGLVPSRALGSLIGQPAASAFPDHALSVLTEMSGATGLLPNSIDVHHSAAGTPHVGLGKGSIEFYESLLHAWIQSGAHDPASSELKLYRTFARDLRCDLLDRSQAGPRPLLFVHSIHGHQRTYRFDLKACRLPGLLALGAAYGVDTRVRPEDCSATEYDAYLGQSDSLTFDPELLAMPDLELAEALLATCRTIHRDSPTGLAPAAVVFRRVPVPFNVTSSTFDGRLRSTESDSDSDPPSCPLSDTSIEFPAEYRVRSSDVAASLGPEYASSLLLLRQVTGNETYGDWAYELFSSLKTWAAVSGDALGRPALESDASLGLRFAPLRNAYFPCRGFRDRLKPSFLGATLKYLWLAVRVQGDVHVGGNGAAVEARDQSQDRLGFLRPTSAPSQQLLLSGHGHLIPIRGRALERELIARVKSSGLLSRFRPAVLWSRTCVPTHVDQRQWEHPLEGQGWTAHLLHSFQRSWSLLLNLGLHRCGDHEHIPLDWSPQGLYRYMDRKWSPLLHLVYARNERRRNATANASSDRSSADASKPRLQTFVERDSMVEDLL